MRQFLKLLARFRSDDRGAFLVIFGILAIVLVATGGAVVDFTTVEQARARAQDALDSAALGLQPRIFEAGITEEALRADAEELLIERLSGQNVTADVLSAAINTTDGSLRLNASIVVPTAFVSLIGYPDLTANLVSEATRKRLNVEVAMVLDNSGSMAQQSRMTNLKAAATCATNILFNGDCASTATTTAYPTVKIGIVPFTEFVNVGTGYKNASWMDGTGVSSLANDNFDSDDNDATVFTGTVNRFALYDQLSNVSWQGCVEARKYPYDTNDTTPNPAVPDTLFVPEFAPDNPDSGSYDNNYLSDSPAACSTTTLLGFCERTDTTEWCNSSGSSCYGSTSTSYKLTAPNGTVTTGWNACSCSGETILSDNTSTVAMGYGFYRKTRVRTCNDSATVTATGLSSRELQERICKYTGSINTSGGRGPNWDCPTNSLLPLTNSKASVTAAITAMYPQGFTNIHQGAIWGFHMLSPTEPLTQGQPYTSATYKVMILMTDGENTVDGYDSSNMNKADGYMAYGYPGPPTAAANDTEYNGRIFSTANPTPGSGSAVTASMDTRTVETCANAKAAGITVYTIGLNSPNQTTTDMLTACASSAANAYFPTQSSELITVFQEIASQLSNLRLAL